MDEPEGALPMGSFPISTPGQNSPAHKGRTIAFGNSAVKKCVALRGKTLLACADILASLMQHPGGWVGRLGTKKTGPALFIICFRHITPEQPTKKDPEISFNHIDFHETVYHPQAEDLMTPLSDKAIHQSSFIRRATTEKDCTMLADYDEAQLLHRAVWRLESNLSLACIAE